MTVSMRALSLPRGYSTFVSLDATIMSESPASKRRRCSSNNFAQSLASLLSGPSVHYPHAVNTQSPQLKSTHQPEVLKSAQASHHASSGGTLTQNESPAGAFSNSTVVITGGSRGIGFSIAQAFRQLGSRVILVGRNTATLETARQKLIDITVPESTVPIHVPVIAGWSAGLDASGVAVMEGDVSNVGQVERICKQIMQQYGPVENLVNCAGISKDSILLTMDPIEAQEVIATNLFGTINMSRGIAKGMLRRRKGCIINVSSVLGIKGMEGTSVYSASKAGVIGFTRSLARELGPRGIRVSAIAPGFIETDMTSSLTEAQRAQYLAQTPMGRFGGPEEVAHAAIFLAQAKYMTGQTLILDGGFSI
ncbi:hypothetical protein CcCBS67573_g03791 [Chytriomyces confervae]|uniref:Ketoreductase domain-containing protein n=1 Tax=Chytriomyces confervae TaxID=246404 RepID=A0A507FFD0_9FUNG|nr:hypothetical protein HDU80_010902 [Chytriomyces hyalinus]TPX74933.1 hypothetical protein CcCBS67573_g03791 [Chytriomyces confervae]